MKFIRTVMRPIGLAFFFVSLAQTSIAQETPIPAPLEPWVSWVLYDHPDRVCSHFKDARACTWPGAFSLEVTAGRGHFEMSVFTDRAQTVRLPGGESHWPQEVRVDGSSVGVGEDDAGNPEVRVAAGQHRVNGTFFWTTAPEVLQIPPEVGTIELRIDGAGVDQPRTDASGRLWLQDAAGSRGDSEHESLRVSVYRWLADGVPLIVRTRLALHVSGRAREISLENVLIAKSKPTEITSDLPVQVTDSGAIKAYLRPGSHEILIESVLPEHMQQIAVPDTDSALFDPQEVWVWIPDDKLRSVELSGLTTVDPERTSLPEDWRGHTTLLGERNKKLTFNETRRGLTDFSPNQIRLRRSLWLDLDGRGYTVQDEITGTLHRDWRLDHSPEATLGRVHDQNEGALLITQDSEGRSGVELRRKDLAIEADLRIEKRSSQVAIVGWNQDVQDLGVQLNLPPGWTLFHVTGADVVRGTWLDTWTLWHFFFVLLIAFCVGKLTGWKWSFIAIVALVLAHDRPNAPEWTWVHLIVALALLRVLPQGWWRKLARGYHAIALIALTVTLAPFAHHEFQRGLHPQIEQSTVPWSEGSFSESEPAPDPSMELRTIVTQSVMHEKRSKKPPSKQGNWQGQNLQQVDPNAVVQTGPGLPRWKWRSWSLEWKGPVRSDQRVGLTLISPFQNRVLSFLRIFFLLALAFVMVRPGTGRGRPEDGDPTPSATRWLQGTAALLSFMTAVSMSPQHASAGEPVVQSERQFEPPSPSDSYLEVLRTRILAESACDGPCVVPSRVDFDVDDRQVRIRAEVHVQKTAGWFLPGPPENLGLDEVIVDGRPTRVLRRDPGGLVAVRLTEGRHIVLVRGRLVDQDVVTLQFGPKMTPKYVTFQGAAWDVDGIDAHGKPDASLQLTRKSSGSTGAEAPKRVTHDLPPWFHVTRKAQIGLPWQIRTTITRKSSARPQLMRLPLLPDESVITDGLRMDSSEVLVHFARGVNSMEFVSEIPVSAKLTMNAQTDSSWSETWTVECTRIWRCAFSGIPPVAAVGNDDVYRPTWKPWPGEILEIAISRPEGAPGQASTVDSVRYRVTPGKRLMRAELDLTVRASQGSWQRIKLPPAAEVQVVQVQGTEQNIRLEEGALNLPLAPGSNELSIRWHQPWERSWRETMPQIDIGSKAVNIDMEMSLGESRWLIWTHGPAWGPAVLFWSHLLMLLLLSLVLSMLRTLPVRWWEWFLLVIGMSQLPTVLLVVVVGWFVAMIVRGKHPADRVWLFQLTQLGLVFWTLVVAGILCSAVYNNLLFDVNMQVDGGRSTNDLFRWYVDRVDGVLPTPSISSLSIYVWKVVMLFWAFWLVQRLTSWAKWGWNQFSHEDLWRSVAKPNSSQPPVGRGRDNDAAEAQTPPTLASADTPPKKEATSATEAAQVARPDEDLPPEHDERSVGDFEDEGNDES
jgi:hypothetical protein